MYSTMEQAFLDKRLVHLQRRSYNGWNIVRHGSPVLKTISNVASSVPFVLRERD